MMGKSNYLENHKTLRTQGDSLADDLIKTIMDKEYGEQLLRTIFGMLQHNLSHKSLIDDLPKRYHDQIKGDELENLLNTFFEATSTMPDWWDHGAVRDEDKTNLNRIFDDASEVFEKWMPEIMHLLLVCSLPITYVGEKGAKVLLSTGRLIVNNQGSLENAKRRISETSLLVLHCLSKDGLKPGINHKGIATIQKVRLAHALIRYNVQNPQETEKPINQEDMLGTLMAFSVLIVKSLELLLHKNTLIRSLWPKKNQIKPLTSRYEYINAWNVVGYLLGLKKEYLPIDKNCYQESFDILKLIMEGQAIKNVPPENEETAGKKLMHSLLQIINEFITDEKVQKQQSLAIACLMDEISQGTKYGSGGLQVRIGLPGPKYKKNKSHYYAPFVLMAWAKLVQLKAKSKLTQRLSSFQEYFLDVANISGVPVPKLRNDKGKKTSH